MMGGGGGLLKTILPIAATALGAYWLGPMIAAEAGVSAAAGTAIGGAAGGLAGQAATGGLGQQSIKVDMPTPSTPTEMPQIGGTETQAAQTKTLSALRQRQGRAASILSQGGMDNTSSKLGG